MLSDTAGRILLAGKVTGDTQNRLTIDTSGKLTWGPGNAAADCILFRNAAGELRTTDTMLAAVRGAAGSMAFSAHVTGDGTRRFYINANGATQWSDGVGGADCQLYRRGAKELGFGDTFLTVQRTLASDLAFRSLQASGDTAARFNLYVNGMHTWGDGTSAVDCTLVRNSAGYMIFTLANVLEVSGGAYIRQASADFTVGLLLQGTTATSARTPGLQFRDTQATPKRLTIRKDADQTLGFLDDAGVARATFDLGGAGRVTTLPGGLTIGNDAVSSGALLLQTNGYVAARYATGAGSAALVSKVTGDAQDRFQVWAGGTHVWGDGTNPVDTTLARGVAGRLHLGTTAQKGALRAYGGVAGDNVFEALVTTDAQLRLQVSAMGSIYWGDGAAVADTNLSRSAAARLALTGMLTTTLGVQTKTKAGAPVDADWATAPPDGTLAVDTTGNAMYFRSGGTWRSVSGGGAAALTVISDTTLGAAAASIDLTSIPQTYTHLYVVVIAKSVASSGWFSVKINNDGTAANYSSTQAPANSAGGATLAGNGSFADSTSPASGFGILELSIPLYATTLFNKTIRALQSGYSVGAAQIGAATACSWLSTAAITRLTFSSSSGNLAAGSRVILYGSI